MKKLLFWLMLLALTSTTYAQTKLTIGDKVPDIQFENILNSRTEQNSLKNLAGKIVILDFWATWCGPCIPAMKNLIQLQDEFPNDIQVIGIAEDKPERLQRFIDNTPSKVWFGLQTEMLEKYFPYRILSHAVVINPKGEIVAITSTDNITKEIIQDVKAGKSITLPLKQENIKFDYTADPFPVKDPQTERILLKSGITGVSTYSRGYLMDETFKGRRITLVNYTVPNMYRSLYKTTANRTIYEVDKKQFDYKDPKNKYCLDIISKNAGDEMYAMGIKKLVETFKTKARLEKRTVPVYVVRVIDREKLKVLKSVSAKRTLEFRGYEFQAKKIHIIDFTNYIENETRFPVIDETNYLEFIDIDFVFDPQKKGSFTEELAKIGLELKKTEREVEMLVIY